MLSLSQIDLHTLRHWMLKIRPRRSLMQEPSLVYLLLVLWMEIVSQYWLIYLVSSLLAGCILYATLKQETRLPLRYRRPEQRRQETALRWVATALAVLIGPVGLVASIVTLFTLDQLNRRCAMWFFANDLRWILTGKRLRTPIRTIPRRRGWF